MSCACGSRRWRAPWRSCAGSSRRRDGNGTWHNGNVTRRSSARRWQGGCLAAVLVLLVFLLPGARGAVAQTTQATLAERVTALEQKVTNLQSRLMHFTRVNNDIFITGANLHIRSGLRATNGSPQDPFNIDPAVTRTNGFGNLIIGYMVGPATAKMRPHAHPDAWTATASSRKLTVGTRLKVACYAPKVSDTTKSIPHQALLVRVDLTLGLDQPTFPDDWAREPPFALACLSAR